MFDGLSARATSSTPQRECSQGSRADFFPPPRLLRDALQQLSVRGAGPPRAITRARRVARQHLGRDGVRGVLQDGHVGACRRARARRDGLGARLLPSLRANDHPPPRHRLTRTPRPLLPTRSAPACTWASSSRVLSWARRCAVVPPAPRRRARSPPRRAARARPPVAGRRSSLAARRGSPFLGLSPPRVRARARAFATPRAAGPRAPRRRDHPRVSRAVANPAGSLDLARSRREFARPRWPPTRKNEAPIPRHPASLKKTNNPNPRLSSVRSTDLKRIPPPNVPPTRS